jgi:hypothetical protein
MSSAKPTILFFARDYQSELFPLLKSDKFNSVYAVLNISEKINLIRHGVDSAYCFEELFDSLNVDSVQFNQLEYSYGADRSLIGLNLEERELILKKTHSFWITIFSSHKVDYVINETVAIESSEVLAIESQNFGVKYLSWMSFAKPSTFFWQCDTFNHSIKIALDQVNINDIDIDKAREYIEEIKHGLAKPFYINKVSNRYSLRETFKCLYSLCAEQFRSFRLGRLKNLAFYSSDKKTSILKIKLQILSIIFQNKTYDSLYKYQDREIIFFPIHYEPEAFLLYNNRFYDNQLSLVENILKCVPVGKLLVVKEHPQQPGVLIQSKWLYLRKRFPNVIFIKAEIDSIEVLNNCSTLITLGSTAGFEALALGKRVILLGNVFYDFLIDVHFCESFEDLHQLLRQDNFSPNTENLVDFVARLLKYLSLGNPFPHDKLYDRQNIENLILSIEDKLDSNYL